MNAACRSGVHPSARGTTGTGWNIGMRRLRKTGWRGRGGEDQCFIGKDGANFARVGKWFVGYFPPRLGAEQFPVRAATRRAGYRFAPAGLESAPSDLSFGKWFRAKTPRREDGAPAAKPHSNFFVSSWLRVRKVRFTPRHEATKMARCILLPVLPATAGSSFTGIMEPASRKFGMPDL